VEVVSFISHTSHFSRRRDNSGPVCALTSRQFRGSSIDGFHEPSENRLAKLGAAPALGKETQKMGHVVHIHSDQQYLQALGVRDKIGGTWQGIGTSAAPVLLLTEAQYTALVEAGVVPSNGEEAKTRGKKAAAKKTNS